ncbi:hypothetical protein C8R45DRAFT_1067778 [Mycena sanguinolenta]|nr:hypothetical protein C8R45DRAFT_1067778 [Mycena sanguinolenta]
MAHETHADEELASESTGGNTGSASYGRGGALISGSEHFTIAGGTFTNITKNYTMAPPVPADFPRIPMGDIDLQREIRLGSHGRLGIVTFRRLYSATIQRGNSRMTRTVAVYQGGGAEQEWRRDIAKYITVRFVAATAFPRPLEALAFCDIQVEFQAVCDYFKTIFQHSLSAEDCTFFIRRSTGRFCADLVPGGADPFYDTYGPNETTQHGFRLLAGEAAAAATIVDSLTLHKYHNMCYWQCSATRSMSIPNSTTINIGSVFSWASKDAFDVVEIAWLPNAELWQWPPGWHTKECSVGEVMPDGWTRCNSHDVADAIVSLSFRSMNNDCWLSQANHIFTALQISSNLQDYGVNAAPLNHCWLTSRTAILKEINFTLAVCTTEVAMPIGFLFLCPPEDFQTGECSFKWPTCPAYWSLDQSGGERLTSEEAGNLGFPPIQLSTDMCGRSWEASVYAGLRQFHRAKCFDPHSQNLARRLRYPLYQFSPVHTLFAHIDDGDSPKSWDVGDTGRDEESSCELESTPKDCDLRIASVLWDLEAGPVSRAFTLVMNVQLSLILFLGIVSLLYTG